MNEFRNQSGDRREDASHRISLEVNPDDVAQLIQLARDFHAEDAVVLTDEPQGPDWETMGSVVSDHGGNVVLEEFRNIIEDYDRAQQVQVVALMWLGRGDCEPEEWDSLLEDAEDAWSDHTADYLLAHPMVADHLMEGLDLLGYSIE